MRPLHLPLDAGLNVAVQVQLFNLNVQHVGDARQPRRRIENAQQLLLLLDAQLQVGGNGVAQLGRFVHAHRGDDGLVVQRLLQLDVLLKERGHALHQLLDRRGHLKVGPAGTHGGHKKTVAVVHLGGLGALHALHQDLDISVGHFYALHDIADGPDLVDLLGLGLVDRGVVLRGEKDLAVAGERFFKSPHAGLAPHHEGRHHVRKNHHVPDGHHGQLARLGLFAGCGHSAPMSIRRTKPALGAGWLCGLSSDCTANGRNARRWGV